MSFGIAVGDEKYLCDVKYDFEKFMFEYRVKIMFRSRTGSSSFLSRGNFRDKVGQ